MVFGLISHRKPENGNPPLKEKPVLRARRPGDGFRRFSRSKLEWRLRGELWTRRDGFGPTRFPSFMVVDGNYVSHFCLLWFSGKSTSTELLRLKLLLPFQRQPRSCLTFSRTCGLGASSTSGNQWHLDAPEPPLASRYSIPSPGF